MAGLNQIANIFGSPDALPEVNKLSFAKLGFVGRYLPGRALIVDRALPQEIKDFQLSQVSIRQHSRAHLVNRYPKSLDVRRLRVSSGKGLCRFESHGSCSATGY